MPEFFIVFAWVATIVGSVLFTYLLLYAVGFLIVFLIIHFHPDKSFVKKEKEEPMDISGGKGTYTLSCGRKISIFLDKYGRPSQRGNYDNKPTKPDSKLYENI